MRKTGNSISGMTTLSLLFVFGFFIVSSYALPLNLDQLYSDIGRQPQQGEPIVVTSYIGLWYDHSNEPERNLYWGNLGGHYFLFSNSSSIATLPDRYRQEGLKRVTTNIRKAVVDNLKNYKWERIYYEERDSDPTRIAVFKMTVEPNEFWKSMGVTKPFIIYNIMLAYSDMERAMGDMVAHLKQDKARVIGGDQLKLDLGNQSLFLGYIGHNVYYGGTCGIDTLETLPYTSSEKKGLFFLGCQSSEWCTSKFEAPSVANLLFCKTNMAPEGYIMLALLDGLSRGLKGDELVTLCNRVYGIAQGQGPDISLFVNGNLKTQGSSASAIPMPAPAPATPSPTLAEAPKPEDIEKLRREYLTIKEEVKAKRDEFRVRYEATGSDEEKNKIIRENRAFVFEILTESIFPAWHGTNWGFNGSSRTPGKGKIACGTFVIYTLQDAGFKIPSKMARQPSENIIKNMIGPSPVKRFWNSASMEKVLNWVRSRGEGLYVVGLDIHVGYIIYNNDKVTFCHSSYYNPPRTVVNQDAMGKSPLTDSKYRVLGKILDDGMMIKWIRGEEFPITYDYFRRHEPGLEKAKEIVEQTDKVAGTYCKAPKDEASKRPVVEKLEKVIAILDDTRSDG